MLIIKHFSYRYDAGNHKTPEGKIDMTSTAIVVTVLGIVFFIVVPMTLLTAYVVYRLTSRTAHLHGTDCWWCARFNSACRHVTDRFTDAELYGPVDHNSVCAPHDHNHDSLYTRLGHVHSEYADHDHTHDIYADVNHDHDNYAAVDHDHDDRYATRDEFTALSDKTDSKVGIYLFADAERRLNDRVDEIGDRVNTVVAIEGSRVPKGMLIGSLIGALVGFFLVRFFLPDSHFTFAAELTTIGEDGSTSMQQLVANNPALRLGYIFGCFALGGWLGGVFAWIDDRNRIRHSNASN